MYERMMIFTFSNILLCTSHLLKRAEEEEKKKKRTRKIKK